MNTYAWPSDPPAGLDKLIKVPQRDGRRPPPGAAYFKTRGEQD